MDQPNLLKSRFYDLFWKHEGLRQLMLHNREELLEYQEIDVGGKQRTVFFPRLVLANYTDEEASGNFLPVSTSGEGQWESIQTVQEKWEPLRKELDAVVGQRYRKAISKLDLDLRDPLKATKLAMRVLRAIRPSRREQALLDLLRDYKMIGSNVVNFSDLAEQLESEVRKNVKKIVNERQVSRFYETISAIRQAYQEVLLRRLHSANRLQVEVRIDAEQFQDRLHWLDLLHEHGFLEAGREEVWFSCGHCGPDVFSGYGKWNMAPGKLQELSCPVCAQTTRHLAPYHLVDPVFEDLVAQDGLILPAIRYLLEQRGWPTTANLVIPPDTELDLCFDWPNGIRAVTETKMFKLDVPVRKLKSKIIEAAHQLEQVRKQLIAERPVYAERQFFLITNCSDRELIDTLNRDLHKKKVEVEVVSAVNFDAWLDHREIRETGS